MFGDCGHFEDRQAETDKIVLCMKIKTKEEKNCAGQMIWMTIGRLLSLKFDRYATLEWRRVAIEGKDAAGFEGVQDASTKRGRRRANICYAD